MKFRVVKKNVLRQRLIALGFEEEKAKDHIFFYFKYGEKIVVQTKYSHSGNEIRQPILGLIARQIYLTRQEFMKLLEDNFSFEDYIRILKMKGKIE